MISAVKYRERRSEGGIENGLLNFRGRQRRKDEERRTDENKTPIDLMVGGVDGAQSLRLLVHSSIAGILTAVEGLF